MDLPEDAEPELLEDCTVTKFEHVHACSSSYFDRTGTRILTTSYDDTLRGGFRQRRLAEDSPLTNVLSAHSL